MTHFAKTLNAQRNTIGLTMQVLAEKANVSKSMISKIERDEVQPTLDVASRLAKALGKTLSEMLHPTQTTQVIFLPKEEQALWEDPHHIKRRNISPVYEGLKIEWLQVELPKGASIQKCVPVMKHPGAVKFVLATKGTLEIIVEQQVFQLKKGDSLYFNANVEHGFYNRSKEAIEFYVVVNHE